jgi:hypothetical protein
VVFWIHGGDPARLLGASNDNLGTPGDPVTKDLFAFAAEALSASDPVD